ncbi:MAG: NUDIX domain-containing protein [Pseudomonadales bacterium]|nr:NUDIX domain-containing protein [Pseudomonadales bacterium]
MIDDKDKVIVVDFDDKYVGKMDKFKAHEHPAKLHQAVSVWLINKQGKILLQKRSLEKIVGASWWANAICGNVRPDEIYLNCAKRRLKDEINIENLDLIPVYKFIYKAYCNDKYGEFEFDEVFVSRYEGKVIPNASEVSEIDWVDLDELVAQININTSIPSPEQTLVMSFDQLKDRTAPCQIKINDQKKLLAPWSCMMLRDRRLISALKDLV